MIPPQTYIEQLWGSTNFPMSKFHCVLSASAGTLADTCEPGCNALVLHNHFYFALLWLQQTLHSLQLQFRALVLFSFPPPTQLIWSGFIFAQHTGFAALCISSFTALWGAPSHCMAVDLLCCAQIDYWNNL